MNASSFHDRALSRALMTCCILALLGTAFAYFRYTPAIALSFLLGAVVAIVNLRWLEYSVSQIMDVFESSGEQARAAAEASTPPETPALPEQMTADDPAPEPRLVKQRPRTWPKMVLRYVFLGAIAYAILRGRFVSIGPFLAGLFLPILALVLEGAYEAYHSFKT